jgi:hypothetical protein
MRDVVGVILRDVARHWRSLPEAREVRNFCSIKAKPRLSLNAGPHYTLSDERRRYEKSATHSS